MTCIEKVAELRLKIELAIMPFIAHDYWLLDVPDHGNIGDTLIWQGEMDFLRRNGKKWHCRGAYSLQKFNICDVKDDDLILFNGGGNFGDIWVRHHKFKMEMIKAHPRNEFFFFPQTVYYKDITKMKQDAEFLSNYKCTICARDRVSYDILKDNFKNRILLVPDMAFCMDIEHWMKSYQSVRPLLLKRQDVEYQAFREIEELQASGKCDVTDWTTLMENKQRMLIEKWRNMILHRSYMFGWLYEPFIQNVYRPHLIREGVRLINSHTEIYTTRLHACILSVLLGKEHITLFNNSYGKNSEFYNTWLRDCDAIEMVK